MKPSTEQRQRQPIEWVLSTGDCLTMQDRDVVEAIIRALRPWPYRQAKEQGKGRDD